MRGYWVMSFHRDFSSDRLYPVPPTSPVLDEAELCAYLPERRED